MTMIPCMICGGDGVVEDGRSCSTCSGGGEIAAGFGMTEGHRMAMFNMVVELVTNTTMPTNVFHSYEILEATDETEYSALSDANKAMYNALINCGRVDMNDGKKGRTWLWTLFDSESTTRAALTALLS